KMETEAGSVEMCSGVTGEMDDLNEKLGTTEGVRRNGGIMQDYNNFLSSFAAVKEGDSALEEALNYYRTWHEWILAQEKVDGWEASDTDIMAVAKILINSGNEKFKKYAEGWAEKKKKANTAYRAFHYSDILAKNRSDLLKAMNTAQKEFADWEAKNTISVSEVVSLARADNSKVYTDFDAMNSLIKESYENNYNHGSGDCLETFTDVVCD
ncbi:hypothetical protein IJ096_01715, partial [Candidatus Saccharibacteria bacterium]|nr:hypothetical protein [Candidatus Saccharibacteria bacterium]